MSGPWRWAAAELRLRWRATLVLVVLVGIGGGAVLGALAGARRTESAFGRFRAATLALDAHIQIGEEDHISGLGPAGVEALHQLDALPETASVGYVDLFIGSNPESGYDVGIIAGPEPIEATLGRPRVIEGRLPDPDSAVEVVTNEVTAAEAGLAVGDMFTIATFTPAQIAVIDEEFTGLGGPELDLRLVGIFRLPDDLVEESAGGFYGTPAFRGRHLGEVGSYGGRIGVRFAPGTDPDVGVEEVRTAMRSVDGVAEMNIESSAERADTVHGATGVLADGLRAFAAVAALATLVAGGQAISRRLSALGPDQGPLDAIGLTRAQRAAAALLTVVPVAVGGAAVAVAVAVLASPLLPIGVARLAEPSPGFDVDALALGLGALAVAALTLVLGGLSSLRMSALRRSDLASAASPARLRRSPVVAAAARVSAPAPAVLGVAMALEPGRGPTAVPVRPAIAGAVLGTAGIVAALTFGASLDRLVGTPAAYGWTFDLAPSVYEEDRGVLVASEDVADVGVIDLAQVEVGGRAMQGMGLRKLKGSPQLRVVDGRAPAGPGEVALGGKDLGALDLAVGDEVAMGRPGGGSVLVEIVGRVIFPVLDGNPSDSGALLDAALLDEVALSSGFDQVVVSWADGVDEEAAEARLRERVSGALPVYAYPTPPGSVANLAGVAPLPRVLAGFLVVVALAAIGHALVAGVLRRRRDLAVVRVLGFVRRQVATTVTWQSVTLAAVGLAVGIPLGVAVGRSLWRAVAGEIGVPSNPVLPLSLVAALVPLTLVAGLVFATLPARAAVRHRPADGLRVE